jgi:hypothetical protein
MAGGQENEDIEAIEEMLLDLEPFNPDLVARLRELFRVLQDERRRLINTARGSGDLLLCPVRRLPSPPRPE